MENHPTQQLPKEFVKKHGEILQPTVEMRLEGEPTKSWKVETEVVGKRCFFTEGWSDFAQEVGPEREGTIVFTFVGESAFDVSVYDATGCKKKPPSHEDEAGNIPVVEISHGNQEIVCWSTPTDWSFTKKVTDLHYLRNRMDIPRKFVLATGIQNMMKIRLVDEEGRAWPITITNRGRTRQMFSMPAGSKIRFKFIDASSGPTTNAEAEPRRKRRRGRGRPPLSSNLQPPPLSSDRRRVLAQMVVGWRIPHRPLVVSKNK